MSEKQKILIVDDRKENLVALRKALSDVDAEIVEATSGNEALAATLDHNFAVAILDVQMPGMNGYELAEYLRGDKNTTVLPIVFVTASYADEQHVFRGYEAGGTDYIVKPFAPEILLGKVRTFLEIDRYKRELEEHRDHLDALVRERTQALGERVKELRCLYNISSLIADSTKPMTEILATAVDLLPSAWQYPEITCARIAFEELEFATEGFAETTWGQSSDILVSGEVRGVVEVCYLEERPESDEGPFLKEERALLHNIAREIGVMAERKQAEEERLRIEAQLRQSQKLESIGTLASGIAHEINNPVMGIINYAELIADEIDDESIKPYTDGIVKEGTRVATIVRNLLSFARQEKESHSPAHLKDIIDNSLSLVSSILRKDQITIHVDVPEDLPKVKCRSQRIQQVVINLLTNAHDALNERYPDYDENKTLRISARPFEKEDKTWIRVTVEDHGPGVPEHLMERIFDPFFTTKPRDEGTGLGLSVSYGLVKEHKGRLWVESRPGEYTRFHMELASDNGWSHGNAHEGNG